MDAELGKSVIAGVAAGMTSLAILPMLFKGQLVFKREMDAEKAHLVDVVAIKDKEIGRLQDGLDSAQQELRTQYTINTDLTKQVFSTVQFLQSLAGQGRMERRGKQSDE